MFSPCPPAESDDISPWCSRWTERHRTPTHSRYAGAFALYTICMREEGGGDTFLNAFKYFGSEDSNLVKRCKLEGKIRGGERLRERRVLHKVSGVSSLIYTFNQLGESETKWGGGRNCKGGWKDGKSQHRWRRGNAEWKVPQEKRQRGGDVCFVFYGGLGRNKYRRCVSRWLMSLFCLTSFHRCLCFLWLVVLVRLNIPLFLCCFRPLKTAVFFYSITFIW